MNVPTAKHESIYISVGCPKCDAKAGDRCMTLRAQSEAGYQFPTAQPHKARVDAYEKWCLGDLAK